MKKWNNKGISSEYLPWLLIALAILVILTLSIFLLKDKGLAVLDGIKQIFRGR